MNCTKCNIEVDRLIQDKYCSVKCLLAAKNDVTGAICESCDSNDASFIKELNSTLCTRCANVNLHSTEQKLISEAREMDSTIQFKGDIYNAKVLSINAIKEQIDADDSIPADEKVYKFHESLANRYEHLSRVIFDRENENHADSLEKIAINRTLQYATLEIRKEIREKIAASDSSYQPPIKKVIKPKVQPKIDTFERAVQALATALNIPLYEARERIEKGQK